MQVFVFEFLAGGGIFDNSGDSPPADPLFCEGMSMLRALAADLAAAPEIDVLVQLDSRLQKTALAGCDVYPVSSASEELASFRRLAAMADATIVIAPEFDDLLLRRCQMVEEVGGRLLGPCSADVAVLADKLATAKRLWKAGVPTPETHSLAEFFETAPVAQLPAVLKPRFGAGSQDVRLLNNPHAFAGRCEKDKWLLQKFHRGHPVSVAALCGPRQIELLPAVTQRLSEDGRFRYLGGRLPVADAEEKRAHRLVRAALGCFPRLSGFVGFDLVLGYDDRGSDDMVIEINPRLTTSYLGLRRICQQNLAKTMMDIAVGKTAALSFSREPVEFSPEVFGT